MKTEENLSLNKMLAVSKALARSKQEMTMTEKKLACMVLSKIKWTQTDNNLYVHLKKADVIDTLGLESDSTDSSAHLRRIGDLMVQHSMIRFSSEDSKDWKDTMLFTQCIGKGDELIIRISEAAAAQLEGLEPSKYITLFLSDVVSFSNDENGRRAYALYQYLRLTGDNRRENTAILSVKDLKKMWGIPKTGAGSYMRKDGHFDRAAFERFVLKPVLRQLAECQHVVIDLWEHDELYSKIKQHGRVLGYQVRYRINRYPYRIRKNVLVETADGDVKTIKRKDERDRKRQREREQKQPTRKAVLPKWFEDQQNGVEEPKTTLTDAQRRQAQEFLKSMGNSSKNENDASRGISEASEGSEGDEDIWDE